MADNSLAAQFTFGTPTKLQLGGPLGSSQSSRQLRKVPNELGAVSFSARGSVRTVGGRRRSVKASPFASISMALPFAAATVSQPAVQPAGTVAPKKKKSLAEIMDYAGKKALSGGLPGMVAMALQVLSMMWLR